jgi:hypothetical protein
VCEVAYDTICHVAEEEDHRSIFIAKRPFSVTSDIADLFIQTLNTEDFINPNELDNLFGTNIFNSPTYV